MSYTELVVLLDRSGSMEALKNDMESGFNNFIKEQRTQPGMMLVTMVQFDSVSIETVYSEVPVAEVIPLCLQPRGATPLIDAFCDTIDKVGVRINYMTTKPDHVLMLIITDGRENHSTCFTKEAAQQRAKHQAEIYKWQFIYLGANVDAFDEARALGVPTAGAAVYTASSEGVAAAYDVAARAVIRGRQGMSVGLTDEERNKLNS